MAIFELEQELIEKISRLDREKQHQVLGYVDSLLDYEETQSQMPLSEWLRLADQSLTETQTLHGENFTVNIQSALDEIREEPTDERLGRR